MPLFFCNLCAQKIWSVRTFLEMNNICATTREEISDFLPDKKYAY